jgi:hypothetical protein
MCLEHKSHNRTETVVNGAQSAAEERRDSALRLQSWRCDHTMRARPCATCPISTNTGKVLTHFSYIHQDQT